MATERIIERIKSEALEAMVKATAPETAAQQVLQSSAWNNKDNHNRGCVNPQLAEIKSNEEEKGNKEEN